MVITGLTRNQLYLHWYRGFESHPLRHVGTSFARSDFLLHKKSVTRSTVPPFLQKVPLRLRRGELRTVIQMDMDICHDGKIRMPQPVLNLLERYAVCQQNCY